MTPGFPRFRPVADQAVLVEFSDVISDVAHVKVLSLDKKLAWSPFVGFTESVPAYVGLLVMFDAAVTDHDTIQLFLENLLESADLPESKGIRREVEICYDVDFAPDLEEVANETHLTPEAVINAHLAHTYQVVMYGFAPGYAYLVGVPPSLRLPRKPRARRGVAAGSVIIAGPQCLITTLTMPTGWWIIGRSPTRILLQDPSRPFLFDVGDTVQFKRIDRARFEATGTVK